MITPGQGKPKRGQKWDSEKQVWYYPEGYVPAPPKKRETKKAVSAEDVAKIVAEALSKQREEILSEVKDNVVNITGVAPIDKTEIPESDLLDESRVYYTLGASFGISGYRDRGRDMIPPYGKPIKFNMMPPMVRADSKGNREEVQWSKCELWSKKLVKYLEESPFFVQGIVIHNPDGLTHEDLPYHNYKIQAINEVNRLNIKEVQMRCQQYPEIKVDGNFERMRTDLVSAIIKNHTMQARERQKNTAVRSSNEENLA